MRYYSRKIPSRLVLLFSFLPSPELSLCYAKLGWCTEMIWGSIHTRYGTDWRDIARGIFGEDA